MSRTPRNDLATLQHKNITFSRLEVTLFIADKFSEHAKSTLRAKLDYSAERIRFGVVTLEMWMAFSIVVVQFICFLETTVFNQQLHRSSAVLCRSDGFVQHVSGHARPLTETIFIPGANPI